MKPVGCIGAGEACWMQVVALTMLCGKEDGSALFLVATFVEVTSGGSARLGSTVLTGTLLIEGVYVTMVQRPRVSMLPGE